MKILSGAITKRYKPKNAMKIFNRNMRVSTLKRKLNQGGDRHTVYETQTDFLGWLAGVGAILLTGMIVSFFLIGTRIILHF